MILIATDMNIPCNLEFYRQIVEFENGITRTELTFHGLDHSKQRTVQSLAHSRGLEYEYQQGYAKVFRSPMASFAQPPAINTYLPEFVPTVHEVGAFDSLQTNPMNHHIDDNNSIYPTSNPDPWFPTQPTYTSSLHGPFNSMHSPAEAGVLDSRIFSDAKMTMVYTADESVPILDLRYHEGYYAAPPPPVDSRRLSGNSFTMSTCGQLSEMPSYEERSQSLYEGPSFSYLPPYAHGVTSRSNSLNSSAQLSPIASPRIAPVNRSESKNASRSGSVSSLRSERGRARDRPKERSWSTGQSDSRTRQSPYNRPSSSQLGRSGPLDYLTRVGMKAVKAVGGACWRCKILGKKVSNPLIIFC